MFSQNLKLFESYLLKLDAKKCPKISKNLTAVRPTHSLKAWQTFKISQIT